MSKYTPCVNGSPSLPEQKIPARKPLTSGCAAPLTRSCMFGYTPVAASLRSLPEQKIPARKATYGHKTLMPRIRFAFRPPSSFPLHQKMVELVGIEPTTSGLQSRCSPG